MTEIKDETPKTEGNEKAAGEITEDAAAAAADGKTQAEDTLTSPVGEVEQGAAMVAVAEEPSARPDHGGESVEIKPELREQVDSQEETPTSVEESDETPKGGFVNQGLIRWEAARHAWLGDREHGSDDSAASSVHPTAVPLDVDKIIDILFYSSSREARAGTPERFPRNVPLPQMIDILQDLWEAEGLDA